MDVSSENKIYLIIRARKLAMQYEEQPAKKPKVLNTLCSDTREI